MTGWNEFPNEILSHTFKFLRVDDYKKQEDLGECALTCQSWKTIAQQHYFRAILICSDRDLHIARSILVDRDDDLSLGLLVKKLKYEPLDYYQNHNYTSHKVGTSNSLTLVDRLFPHLQILEYEPYGHVDMSFCLLYYMMLYRGRFKYIKHVPVNKYDDEKSEHRIELYEKCVEIVKQRNKNWNDM